MKKTEGLWLPDDRKCRNCGKRFTVLHSSQWAYKRPKGPRYEYFCSWGCLRADEKRKEAKDMRGEKTITPEQKDRALEMAMAGESPLPYLKECGAANPSATWDYIRRKALMDDPVKYNGKLPQTFGHKKKEEPAVELVYDPSIAEEYKKEQEEKAERAMREERGRRIAEGLDRADQMREQMIDGIQPLPVAAVYSRTIDGARFKKMDGGMMLTTADYCIRLTAYEWFKLTEEILVAIRQLDATKPEMEV